MKEQKITVTCEGGASWVIYGPPNCDKFLSSYAVMEEVSVEQVLTDLFRHGVSMMYSKMKGEVTDDDISTLIAVHDSLKRNRMTRCVYCESCGKHGHTTLPENPGFIVLCGPCIFARIQRDSAEGFERYITEEYERRTGEKLQGFRGWNPWQD